MVSLRISHWPKFAWDTLVSTHPTLADFEEGRELSEGEAFHTTQSVECFVPGDTPLDSMSTSHAEARFRWCLGQVGEEVDGILLENGFDTNGKVEKGRILFLRKKRESDGEEEEADVTVEEEKDVLVEEREGEDEPPPLEKVGEEGRRTEVESEIGEVRRLEETFRHWSSLTPLAKREDVAPALDEDEPEWLSTALIPSSPPLNEHSMRTVFVWEGEEVLKVDAFLPPHTLDQMASQRIVLVCKEGKRCTLYKVQNKVCVNQFVVDLETKDGGGTYTILSSRPYGGGIGPLRGRSVSQVHHKKRLDFERR